MSVAAAADDRSAERSGPLATSVAERPLFIVLVGFVASFLMSWPHLVEVWRLGGFADTDDAMRLVQVRNWMGGQGWFDLFEHRLHPPGGLLMHWSRVVDMPVAALIRLFEVVAPLPQAETLARIVFPLALQLALIAIAVHLGRLLAGVRATLPAAILVVATGFMFEQFPAGRIDHHAPQIVLLMCMTATVLGSLSPAGAWQAVLTGLCAATSMAISLENLPFMVVIVAVLPLVWVARPDLAQRPLLWFAVGLAVCVPLWFVATVPPARYGAAACDAFSIAHVLGGVAGAAGLAALAGTTSWLPTWPRRAIALGLVGAGVLGVMLATYPACLHDPFANMDPRLRTLWLAHVAEAQPLLAASKAAPDTFTLLFCPLAMGAIGAVVAIVRSTGIARVRWGAILALILVGMTGSLWEIRVVSSTQPIAVMGGLWAITAAMAAAQKHRSALGNVAAVALILPFTTFGWAVAPVGGSQPVAQKAAQAQSAACHLPASLAPLAALPPGLVFAPIDDGSHILVHTPMSVVAAPYHRNQAGNLAVLEGFMAPPEAAEALVRQTGARYVAICPGEVQMVVMTRERPDGLAAQLQAGTVPPWLRAVPLANTPVQLFELQ